MIKDSKIKSAYSALQQIFIKARTLEGDKSGDSELYELLDGAEYLAGLAARDEDKTLEFESYLRMMSDKKMCKIALDKYLIDC